MFGQQPYLRSAQTPNNKYKRPVESIKDQNYQQKYLKLEENFKRFTKNLQEKRQTKSPCETNRVENN